MAVMKTEVGMLVEARQPSQVQKPELGSFLWLLSSALPLLLAALAQKTGLPRRDCVGHSKPIWLPDSWGGGQCDVESQVGRLRGALAAPLTLRDRGPAL